MEFVLLSFPDNRRLWLTPLSLVEGLQYPLLARSCYSRQSVLRTVWFLCFFFVFVLFFKTTSILLQSQKNENKSPDDDRNQDASHRSGASFLFSKVVQRGKKVDWPITECKERWEVDTTTTSTLHQQQPDTPSEWSNLLTAQKARKSFLFFSMCNFRFRWKNRQCPIFATSSPPCFILDKTLFWKKINTK